MKSFRERVLERVAEPDENGCRIWLGTLDKKGYGVYGRAHGTRRAARIVWELNHNPIPVGMDADHWRLNEVLVQSERMLCSRKCVCHLRIIPSGENVKASPGRRERLRIGTEIIAARNRNKTHCPLGHLYAGANLIRRRNRRICRECSREYDRRHDRKRPGPVRERRLAYLREYGRKRRAMLTLKELPEAGKLEEP